MFEGAVAAFLNRLLGRYAEDLDIEHFNIGIFSGETFLTDLKLKPEALYQLGLPIRVEIGIIGKISLKIPWTSLFTQPIVLTIEDIYIVAVPATSGRYDPEIQKRLMRASKKKILDDLEDEGFLGPGLPTGLLDSLMLTIVKNFQITVNNVHIRYEERFADRQVACGLCAQTISMATTNNKWKPGVTPVGSTSIYQLIRVESLSLYLDPRSEPAVSKYPETWEFSNLLEWKAIMKHSLHTFVMNNKDFHFLVKPFTTKIKIIVNKNSEGQVSRMLVDVVLQDVTMQLSDEQFETLCQLWDSCQHGSTERCGLERNSHPICRPSQDPKSWWRYACNAILEHTVRPYTWKYIKTHRKNYKLYKESYMHTLMRPNDTELKLDLQKYEDYLTTFNIIIAREHAKIELRKRSPDCVTVNGGQGNNLRLIVNAEKIVDCSMRPVSPESKKLSVTNNTTNDDENKFKLEKVPSDIDRKYNVTLGHWSLALSTKDQEILVITVTQFLSSIETRPELSYKISARAESFTIEGPSGDGDFIPLATTDNMLTGNVFSNFLAIDFEKNPSTDEFSYDVTVRLETLELTYHRHAVRQICMFFERNKTHVKHIALGVHRAFHSTKRALIHLFNSIVTRTLRINLKLDIKGPYIVFPELGSLQEGGNVLIVDFGRMTFKSELQAINVQLEDATLMELEELLYDRLHLFWTDAQILICHSEDDWRESRKWKDSENHVVPKIQANVTLSCSIKPEYRILPRIKLNVSFSNVKCNLSKGKLWYVCVFVNQMWLPTPEQLEKFRMRLTGARQQGHRNFVSSFNELTRVRSIITLASFIMDREKSEYSSIVIPASVVTESERSVKSSDFSEEDLEQWMKSINNSGFDDNVSPQNRVDLLLRIVIGELSIHAVTTSEARERPYLVLRLCTIYFEAAIMEYGPAYQFGIGSIVLADKTNAGITGSYLELVSTDGCYDVISLSYRKVRANCPDFKSHFRSIEQSFVLNITNLNVVFHRQALFKLKHYCSSVITLPYTNIFKLIGVMRYVAGFIHENDNDPPIPPGAIKLSYSARLNLLVLRLCDKEFDFLELRLVEANSDCIYNANQRMILRAHLRGLIIDDLRDTTLYPKVMTTDEDGVLDFKYVRHSPKIYSSSDIGSSQQDVKSDGSLRLSVGKINCVLYSEMIVQCRNFMQPFIRLLDVLPITRFKLMISKAMEEVRTSGTKLHLSIDVQGPTFILPRNSDNPTTIVYDMGILTIENFLKQNGKSRHADDAGNADCHVSIIDNILVKLTSMTISRAIMTLAGVLKVQEPIVEPIQIRLDMKRNTEFRSIMGFNTYGIFEIHGSVDTIFINLGQKDFATMVNIWEDNITKFRVERFTDTVAKENASIVRNVLGSNTDDAAVNKLEAFFNQDEQPVCEISTKLTFEGLQLNLFTDTDEVLSSPVRDLNNGLAKLTFGEVVATLDIYSNRSITSKISLRTCILEDTRKEPAVIRKIIQSPAKSAGMQFESCISVSEPPVFDLTLTQAPTGDKCIDMLVEETRINLSIPFIVRLTHYLVDSLPHETIEQGVVNVAFEDNSIICNCENFDGSSELKDLPGTSVSIRIRKPEILLFDDLTASNAHAILIQAELTIETSQHSGSSSMVCSISNLLAKTKSQQRYRRQLPQWMLRPCDVEISMKSLENDNRLRIDVNLHSLNIHISPGIIYTFNQIFKEMRQIFYFADTMPNNNYDDEYSAAPVNLWSPKKVIDVPCRENKPYVNETNELRNEKPRIQLFNLNPVAVNVSLEMEDTVERIPMIKAHANIGGTWNSVNDRSEIESSIDIYGFCYNPSRQSWEPFIELCTKDDLVYTSWQLSIKMYQAEGYRLDSLSAVTTNYIANPTPKRKKPMGFDNADENNKDMIFIRPDVNVSKIKRPDYTYEQQDDSDSNDDERSEKLATTFGNLFFKDSSDEEDSDSDASSKYEDEGLELTPEHAVKTKCSAETSKSPIIGDPLTTYIIVSANERLDLTVTPNTISTLEIIINAFTKRQTGIPILVTNTGKLCLHNGIGHPSCIQLLAEQRDGSNSQMRLIASREYRTAESPASVPSSPEAELLSNIETSQFMSAMIDNEFPNQNDYTRNDYIRSSDGIGCESPIEMYKTLAEEILKIKVDGFDDALVYCPKWQGYKIVPLRPAKHNVRYHLVVQLSIDHHLLRTISVRSPLQIRNETSYALGLYYKKQLIKKLGLPHIGEALNPFDDNMRLTVIEPEDTYNVPLYIAYHFPIHVLPVHFDTNYQVSERGICWRELSDKLHIAKDVYCNAKDSNCNSVFGVKAVCEENVNFVRTNSRVPQYTITIVPPLSFDNKLPFVVDISVPSVEYEVRIEPGETINVYSLKCDGDSSVIFKIQNYLGSQWSGTLKFNDELENKCVKMFADSDSDSTKPFVLCVQLNKASSWTVVIYAQYWIINKTGLSLQIQESLSNTVDIPGQELIVFSQKKIRNKLIMLKAHQSDWSLPFSLDAISSLSLIACNDSERKRKYRILADIGTSNLSPRFTNIVTFLPYFYIKNNTKRSLRFMEENEDADLWYDLVPGHGVAFWPYTESMKMRLKWKSSQLVSQHFDITKLGKIVLRMENGSALCVDVTGGNNNPFIVTFETYQTGDAPVRVDNLCDDLFLKMNQVNLGQAVLLSPFQSILYTWDDPTENQQLIWNVYNSKTKGYTANFRTDGYGKEIVTFRTVRSTPLTPTVKKVSQDARVCTSTNSMSGFSGSSGASNTRSDDDTDSETENDPANVDKVRKNRAIVYWISYIEKKTQRVLLFTQDENIFIKSKSIVDPECSKREIFCGLAGIGISIVVGSSTLDLNSRELAYACITDSAAHWELDTGKRWKTLTLELSAWMENKYNASAAAQFENYIDVNFTKMHMTKPFFGHLRRTYSPGIWFHVRKSDTLTNVQGYFHRIQIDNQIPGAVFPIILRPGSKKCFTNHGGNPKINHCIEFLLIKQRKATCRVYKKINVAVREFYLDLQQEFLIELIRGLLPIKRDTKYSIASRLKSDLSNFYVPLPGATDKLPNSERNTTVFEHLHISPIKFHVQLLASAEAQTSNSDSTGYCRFIRSIFEYSCKGTFLKRAEFRLPYIDRCGIAVDGTQLSIQLCQSYAAEIRHQFNVMIRSMTMLGNPHGYNFKLPGDYFYDPDAMVIRGDETAEMLSHDVSCLLGYCTTGGQPGPSLNLSITDVGETRVEKKKCGPESTRTGDRAITADYSFSIGVELEMSGLIVRPTENAHEEELRYLLKTLGRRIMGLTQSDGQKDSLKIHPGLISDAIKRAQEMGYNFVPRIRFPRYINPYLATELYSSYKARGMHLLNTVRKSEYDNSDIYWTHAALSNDGRRIALISLRKIYLIEKRYIWGSWTVVWSVDMKELVETPTVDNDKLVLNVNKEESISPPSDDWYLESKDTKTLEWLCRKINTAMILNMESSNCSPRCGS